jgi:hypothetical protein
MSETTTLRPGDPPPFWEGLWHPEGKAEGAIMVKPLVAGQAHGTTIAAPPAAPTAPPAAPAAPPTAMPSAQAAVPAAEAPAAPTQSAAPPQAPAAAQPAAPAQPGGTGPLGGQPRSFVLSLLAQGPLAPLLTLPAAGDPAVAEAIRAKAKELQGAGQLGPALQALTEGLKRSPGDAATYAQTGQTLLAGRAWEDAAHHFLIAYMLNPREASYARMTLHAAWALGYVAWSFQIAQALYKTAPSPDLAEIGRQAQGWLQARTPGAVTTLCPACRTNALLPAPGPCPKCGQQPMGAPANAFGFQGLKLLQQGQGRLFAGATCVTCKEDTVLVVSKGGPRCQACQGAALATV